MAKLVFFVIALDFCVWIDQNKKKDPNNCLFLVLLRETLFLESQLQESWMGDIKWLPPQLGVVVLASYGSGTMGVLTFF